MLPSEYDVAMKLASLGPYKYDMSDAVGIIKAENITREQIEKAVVDFYGGFDMVKCPYNDKCTKYGCPEIVKGFCDADDICYTNMHSKLS